MTVMTSEPEAQKKVREMLTLEQVIHKLPISRSTLLRMEKLGLFPRGTLLTPHKKAWFADTIAAWQKDLEDPDSAVSKAVRAMPKKAKRSGKR